MKNENTVIYVRENFGMIKTKKVNMKHIIK